MSPPQPHHSAPTFSQGPVRTGPAVISAEYIWVFPKIEFLPPQIIDFNKVFHYKPSIFRYPDFWKTPIYDQVQSDIGTVKQIYISQSSQKLKCLIRNDDREWTHASEESLSVTNSLLAVCDKEGFDSNYNNAEIS